MELLGQHRYQLDAKGRIALPRKFAEAFGEGVYLTLGQDDCLWVFPKDEWDRRSEEIRRRPLSGQTARAYSRMFFGFAERMDLDGQGRLVIPQRLRLIKHPAVCAGVGVDTVGEKPAGLERFDCCAQNLF